MSVDVVRYSRDRLTQWVWQFFFSEGALWLGGYEEFQRPTRRHGFARVQAYGHLQLNTIDSDSDVVLPADVKAEAAQKFCEGITVKRWSERSK